jgi:hypothetical protein
MEEYFRAAPLCAAFTDAKRPGTNPGLSRLAISAAGFFECAWSLYWIAVCEPIVAQCSSATRDGNSQEERDQQRAERCFTRDIAQDAQRHPGLTAGLDRAADAIDRLFYGFRNSRDGGFGSGTPSRPS